MKKQVTYTISTESGVTLKMWCQQDPETLAEDCHELTVHNEENNSQTVFSLDTHGQSFRDDAQKEYNVQVSMNNIANNG